MLTYEQAKKLVFAIGNIPDGYNGEIAKVEFAFDPVSGKTIALTANGYFTYQTPLAACKNEALWLLRNHPLSNVCNIEETNC